MKGLILVLALGMPVAMVSAKALSDLPSLLRDAQRELKKVNDVRHDYTWTETVDQDILDGKGAVKEHQTEQYEVMYVGPTRIRRLISRQGTTLSPSEQKQELAKVGKAIKKAQNREAADPDSDDDGEAMMNTFIRIMRLTNQRQGTEQGRPVIICDFDRDPAAKPKNLQEKVLTKISGTVWIDEATHAIVRFQGRLDEGVRVGAGFLASVHEGSDFAIDEVRVNDQLWFMSTATFHVRARVLVAGIRRNITVRDTNFQRFRVNSSSVVGEPLEK